MATKQEQLKAAQEAAKKAREEAKALREELEASKEERKDARKVQAQARKDVRTSKTSLREAAAKVYTAFSEGDIDELNSLADTISEAGAVLAGAVRKFAEAQEQLEEL